MKNKTKSLDKKSLDRLDHSILKVLQEQGRISYVDLAEKVGLSTTPCIERVKRLENEGFIMGYYARLDPQLLEFQLLVFVEISLTNQSTQAFEEFTKVARSLPYVLECHLVSGDTDYLVKARIKDMSEYRTILGDMLVTLPSVKNSKSYIVMEEVKETLVLPVK